MRVFYAAPNTAHQSAMPNSKVWEANLYWPLVDLGHDLTVFDFDYSQYNYNLDPAIDAQRAYIQANRPRFGEELLRQVEKAHTEKPLDLFFSYFYSAYVEPWVIRKIGEMGITTVNWYCNASYQFGLVAEIAPAYHYCLVPEKFRLRDYQRIGARPIYCQEAANPNIYHPYDLPKQYDVTFVGQRYADRPRYLRALLEAGIDVRAWGPGWKETAPAASLAGRLRSGIRQLLTGYPNLFPSERCGELLGDEDMVKMYSRSKISLGFSRLAGNSHFCKADKQVRLRDFEATMSGAFYLVEYFEELTDFFEPGKEIETFRSAGELVKKARYYLEHADERERIRAAGLARATREHTWQKRFNMVFRTIGLG